MPKQSTEKRKRGRPFVTRWASLSAFMTAAKYDEARLAHEMNVLPRTVADWRRGTKAPDIDGFLRLADLLKCDPEKLRTDAPIKKYRNRYANSVLNTQKGV